MQAGDKVLIVGAGVSGLLFSQLSRLWGASLIIATDLVEYRLRMALEFGADSFVNAKAQDWETEVLEATGGAGADVVIVTPGSVAAMQQGLKLAGKGGNVLIYGPLPPGATLPVEVHALLFLEKTLVTTYSCGPDDTRTALELIRGDRVRTKGLITHSFGLDEVEGAMRLAAQAAESLKVVIIP